MVFFSHFFNFFYGEIHSSSRVARRSADAQDLVKVVAVVVAAIFTP